MSRRNGHRSHLLPISTALYVLTVALLLSELDRQYYQSGKESLIKYNFGELFPYDTLALQALSRHILLDQETGATVSRELETEWRSEARRMLAGEGCVFRIRIVPRDARELLVEADTAKFRRLNGWSNTLFYRNFQNVVSYEIAGAAGEAWKGLLSFHYTTPQAYEPVLALTRRYRWWALLIAAGVTAAYGLVLKQLILPVEQVVRRIDAAALASPRLMRRPESALERAYNSLARDAIVLRLAQSIRRRMVERRADGRDVVLAELPGLLVDRLEFPSAFVLDLAPPEDRALPVIRSEAHAKNAAPAAAQEVQGMAARVLAGKPVGEHGTCEEGNWMLSNLTVAGEHASGSVLVVALQQSGAEPDPSARAWQRATMDQVSELVREILISSDLEQQHLRHERSRANISLARNLGHDLTNIISTSKLDILTVRKILGCDPSEISPANRALLNESADGALNSTKMLQELVNIYRSFSYINRPSYEAVSLGAVIDELTDIFTLSLPPGAELMKQYQVEGMPECTVEPRLLKLALFNLLTNAVEAINRGGTDEGRIAILTGFDPVDDMVWISVGDNGSGIRNPDGELATPAEIQSIFRYGVSTKTDDRGEGLGLNWVTTIVETFHGGGITARNSPDGGAEFVIRIRKDCSAGMEQTNA